MRSLEETLPSSRSSAPLGGLGFGRALITLGVAVVTAAAVAVITIAGVVVTLPPTDQAYGLTITELLQDPFVFTVAAAGATVAALLASLAALFLLRDAPLYRGVVIASSVTIISSLLVLGLTPPVPAGAIPIVAFCAGVLSMVWVWTESGPA